MKGHKPRNCTNTKLLTSTVPKSNRNISVMLCNKPTVEDAE